jgi:hypothetical protein
MKTENKPKIIAVCNAATGEIFAPEILQRPNKIPVGRAILFRLLGAHLLSVSGDTAHLPLPERLLVQEARNRYMVDYRLD